MFLHDIKKYRIGGVGVWWGLVVLGFVPVFQSRRSLVRILLSPILRGVRVRKITLLRRYFTLQITLGYENDFKSISAISNSQA